MQCETCVRRKEKQKLASKKYYIRNSEKIINKTLTRRYLKKKDERGEQSGDGDEGSSGDEDTSDRDEGDTSDRDTSDSDTSDSGEGGSEGDSSETNGGDDEREAKTQK